MTPPAAVGLGTVLHPRPGLLTEEFDDAVLIWDDATHQLHHLDLAAALVWEELDGRRSVQDIADELAGDLETPLDVLRADLVAIARQLVELGLVHAEQGPG